jgi:hypothetical protein
MVSPWLAQPGSAGTSAQKPPSSALCTTILTFICAPPSLRSGARLRFQRQRALFARLVDNDDTAVVGGELLVGVEELDRAVGCQVDVQLVADADRFDGRRRR